MERLFNGANLGAFRILHQIGEGGMAKVYKAFQPSMERYVALKVLPSQFAEDPQFVERFIREARTIAQLEHKNILPVYDFGEQNGITYLAMRYVEGGTLKELLSKGRLTLQDVLDLMSQICPALDYAHRRGVIHRDVKPSNVILDSEGAAYLTDFGIAKVVGVSGDLTATGAAIGTPAYMAPEQAMGNTVDARTDIYALGIMLYEMVVGRVPFRADTPMAVLMAHLHEPLPLPSQVDPSVPHDVEAVIIKALAKSPADRYQFAREVVTALRKMIQAAPSRTQTSTLITLIHEVRDSRTVPATTGPVTDPRLLERMEQDYIDGLSAYWIRDWEKARICFHAVLAVDASYKDAASRLTEVENQLKIAELYDKAQLKIEHQDWLAAQQILLQVVSLDKGYKEASAQLDTVKRQLEIASLYAQAEQLSQAGQWQAVLNVFEHIQRAAPDYPDPQELRKKAQQALAEQERLEKIKTTYQRGLQAMESGSWKQAQKYFEQVKTQQPEYGQTEQLLQRALAEQGKSSQASRWGSRRQPAASASQKTPSDTEKTVAVDREPARAAKKTLRIKPVWLVTALGGFILVAVIISSAVYFSNQLKKQEPRLSAALPTSTTAPVVVIPDPGLEPQAEIQSVHQHNPEEVLADDFNESPQGRIKEEIWELGGNCGVFTVSGPLVQDGALRLFNEPSSELLRCQLWLFRGERFPGRSLWPFEARLKYAGEPAEGDSTNWLSILADFDETSLQAACGLRTINGRVYQVFGVWENFKGNSDSLFYKQNPVESNRWFTTRLQINPDNQAFECLFEDHIFGEYMFPDKDLIMELPFARLIESERLPGAVAQTQVDDVYYYPGQEQASQQQPGAGAECPAEISGWRSEFWNNPELSGDPVRCLDLPNLDFNWEASAPLDGGFPADNFSIRFSRVLEFEPATYSFQLIGDDGVRMWIDDETIIDGWKLQPPTEYSVIRTLAGAHKVVVEYFEAVEQAQIALDWRQIPRLESCLPPTDGVILWVDGDSQAPLLGSPELFLHNGATRDIGIVDFSYRFDPAGWQENKAGFIDVPLYPEIENLQQYTVETWVFLDPDSSQLEFFEGFVILPDKFLFRKAPPGQLELVTMIGGEEHQLLSPMMLPRGQWAHVAAVYDGRFLRLYINGRRVAEQPAQGEVPPALHLWLSHPIEVLDGILDETTIYQRPLNEEEILLIYAAGKYGKCKP